eukprot:TRINITY_DN2977_c0_g1_i1.p1 TRINITY_DN2977_c0_g1~~TRINITY_DN2977_c0_g1_i1.p1  ORF type:complete len:627 (-),score=58.53 TRINITY_DN2977_c0_g1_i1:73-1953(-)
MTLCSDQKVTALEFNQDGTYLAVGFSSGRCLIYKQRGSKFHTYTTFYADGSTTEGGSCGVVQMRWCASSKSLSLLVATAFNSVLFRISTQNASYSPSLPAFEPSVYLQQVYNPSSIFEQQTVGPALSLSSGSLRVHSLSMNSDGETFITADEFNVYTWHLTHCDAPWPVLGLQPESMQQVTEVIRVAEYHPAHCNVLGYGTSRGAIRICDTRTSPRVTSSIMNITPNPRNYAKGNGGVGSVFQDYLHAVADVKFCPTPGREYSMISRDFERVILWDLRAAGAVSVCRMHPRRSLVRRMYDLYEASLSQDAFKCAFICEGTKIATGTYDDCCVIWDPFQGSHTVLDASQLYSASSFSTPWPRPALSPGGQVPSHAAFNVQPVPSVPGSSITHASQIGFSPVASPANSKLAYPPSVFAPLEFERMEKTPLGPSRSGGLQMSALTQSLAGASLEPSQTQTRPHKSHSGYPEELDDPHESEDAGDEHADHVSPFPTIPVRSARLQAGAQVRMKRVIRDKRCDTNDYGDYACDWGYGYASLTGLDQPLSPSPPPPEIITPRPPHCYHYGYCAPRPSSAGGTSQDSSSGSSDEERDVDVDYKHQIPWLASCSSEGLMAVASSSGQVVVYNVY